MIKKSATYPWGEREIEYEYFIYKVIDESHNLIISEDTAYTDNELNILKNKFEINRNKHVKENGFIDYNPQCFGFTEDSRKFTVYIQGFLKI